MTASSLLPGTAPVLQFAAVFQSPPAGLIQVTVAGTARSSSPSKLGRNGDRAAAVDERATRARVSRRAGARRAARGRSQKGAGTGMVSIVEAVCGTMEPTPVRRADRTPGRC